MARDTQACGLPDAATDAGRQDYVPYEEVYHRQPDLSHMACYLAIIYDITVKPERKNGWLSPRAQRLWFVGMSDSPWGYRVIDMRQLHKFDPDHPNVHASVRVARHVRIDESRAAVNERPVQPEVAPFDDGKMTPNNRKGEPKPENRELYQSEEHTTAAAERKEAVTGPKQETAEPRRKEDVLGARESEVQAPDEIDSEKLVKRKKAETKPLTRARAREAETEAKYAEEKESFAVPGTVPLSSARFRSKTM